MKIILPLVAACAVMPCCAVVAQQLAPSTVPAQSPAATPEPSTTAQPTSNPAASSAEASPIRRAEPANSPHPEESVSRRAVAREETARPQTAIKEAENRWAAAIGTHDRTTIQSLVAPDFIGVNDSGKVQRRRALLAEVKGDRDTYTSARNERLEVHMFSANLGVVVGTFRAKGSSRDGRAFDRTYRFTDTWMRRSGEWQCIASQNMLVSPK